MKPKKLANYLLIFKILQDIIKAGIEKPFQSGKYFIRKQKLFMEKEKVDLPLIKNKNKCSIYICHIFDIKIDLDFKPEMKVEEKISDLNVSKKLNSSINNNITFFEV